MGCLLGESAGLTWVKRFCSQRPKAFRPYISASSARPTCIFCTSKRVRGRQIVLDSDKYQQLRQLWFNMADGVYSRGIALNLSSATTVELLYVGCLFVIQAGGSG